MKKWLKILLTVIVVLVVLILVSLILPAGRSFWTQLVIVPIVRPYAVPCGSSYIGPMGWDKTCACDGLLITNVTTGPTAFSCFGKCGQCVDIENKYDFLSELIKKQESEPIANPPAMIMQCVYKGKTVFYLPPRCCDIPGVLYSEIGQNICSPDGGLTGTGDGRCKDFSNDECQAVWWDNRTAIIH